MEPALDPNTPGSTSEAIAQSRSVAQVSCPQVSDHGITVLYAPEPGLCDADLVFVHGLGGHPFKTWLYGEAPKVAQPENPRKGVRKLLYNLRKKIKSPNPTNAAAADSHSSQSATQGNDPVIDKDLSKASYCYWPYDLVKDAFPTVRVMTYGYDSNPSHFYRGRTVQMNISQHADQLRQAVSDYRVECRGKPIIFVAHSLGGILVKDAIIQSAKYEYQPDLLDLSMSCFAIIFFGTPHRGANAAAYGEVVANLVDSIPFAPSVYKELLHGLRPDGEKIGNVEKDFNGIVDKNIPADEKIQIYSFQEGKGLTSLNTLDGKVVPDSSSCFNRRDIERTSFVMTNHMDMCRFRQDGQPAFPAFKAGLDDYIKRIRRRQNAQQARLEASRAALSEALDFDERYQRQHDLASLQTFDETFTWVWQSELADWLTSLEPLFWISGKPASGKSTLVSYLTNAPETKMIAKNSVGDNFVLVHHFFNFRAGDRIGNNFRGFLQSMLVQLVNELPENTPGLSTLNDALTRSHISSSGLSIDLMRKSLSEILLGAACGILILLDGLDEYAGNHVEFALFVKSLRGNRLKICVASRPDPPYSDSFRGVPSLAMHQVNESGISLYASRSLHDFFSDRSTDLEVELGSVRDFVVQRAEGVFLWARFAVLELMSAICMGYSTDAASLQAIVRDVPKELAEIYSRIIRRLPERDKKTCALVLLLTTASVDEVQLDLLQIAIGTLVPHIKSFESLGLPTDTEQVARFQKRITAATRGLAEMRMIFPPDDFQFHLHKKHILASPEEAGDLDCCTVRLSHRTVQTYLADAGWQQLLGNDFHAGLGEELWLKASIATINARKSWLLARLRTADFDFNSLKYLRTTDFDFNSLTYKRRESSFGLDKITHRMLSYAITHWLEHASNFEQQSNISSFPILKDTILAQIAKIHNLATYRCGCSHLSITLMLQGALTVLRRGGVVDILHAVVGHSLRLFVRDFLSHYGNKMISELDSNMSAMDIITDYDWPLTPANLPESGIITAIAMINLLPIKDITLQYAASYWGFQADHTRQRSLAREILDTGATVTDHVLYQALKHSSAETIRTILEHRVSYEMSFEISGSTIRCYKLGLLAGLEGEYKFGMFWPLGTRDRFLRSDDLDECIDILLAQGQDINAQCGPLGTVLHSLVDGRKVYGRPFEHRLKIFLAKGADISRSGLYGNALEFGWLIVNRSERESTNDIEHDCEMIRSLIAAGAVNCCLDPNGMVPSQEFMLYWAKNPERHAELKRFYWDGQGNPLEDTHPSSNEDEQAPGQAS